MAIDTNSTQGGATSRRFLIGTNVAVTVVLVVGIIAVVQAIAYSTTIRFDMTSTGINSLSPGTENLLRNLDQNVRITSLYFETDREDELVSDKDLPKAWPRPCALLQKLNQNVLEEEPLNKTWGHFFPEVPKEKRETYSYPLPLSEDFWRLYAEPLGEFYAAANTLRSAVQDLAHIKPKATADAENEQALWRGIDTLHALVAPASPTIRPTDDGSFEQRWVAPSLLGSFAMMVLQDVERKRPLECKACGRPFLSTGYQTLYCSSTCRYREQKRRQRAKKKEENHGQTRSE